MGVLDNLYRKQFNSESATTIEAIEELSLNVTKQQKTDQPKPATQETTKPKLPDLSNLALECEDIKNHDKELSELVRLASGIPEEYELTPDTKEFSIPKPETQPDTTEFSTQKPDTTATNLSENTGLFSQLQPKTVPTPESDKTQPEQAKDLDNSKVYSNQQPQVGILGQMFGNKVYEESQSKTSMVEQLSKSVQPTPDSNQQTTPQPEPVTPQTQHTVPEQGKVYLTDADIQEKLASIPNPFKDESITGQETDESDQTEDDEEFEVDLPSANFNYKSNPKKKLVTEAERIFYLHLKKALPNGLFINLKTRLFDLVNVDEKKTPKLYYSVIMMHVDYALIDINTLTPVLVIELDDRSHRGNKRRDNKKDKALKDSGIPILRVKCAKAYNIDKLRKMIQSTAFRY